ncbi:anti-sigma factor [Dactylosporangium sp. CA-092794]|uniref:anti-sigma factor n=1 Tax=Dactylosporangium sp. CA-092794 TaxID=3239929 RepID=UPI003D91885B
MLAAVAAAEIAVLVRRGGDGGAGGTVCRGQDARARLEAMPGAPRGAGGYACLRSVNGERRLVMHAEGLAVQRGADYEAWLLDGSGPAARAEALGVLGKGPDLSVIVPASLDLSRYSIVDISAEAHDGDATHSGRSVLRGRLP